MKKRVLIVVTALVLLSGCMTDDLLHKPAYTLSGIPKDQPLFKTVDSFLKTRVATIQKSKDKEEQARQEAYQERTIAADLVARLQAEGYYDAKVSFAKQADKDWAGTYTAAPGPKYTIGSIAVTPGAFASFLDPAALPSGAPLVAADVLAVQTALLAAMARDKCYFALDIRNEVMLNRATHTGAINFVVTAGPQANFGDVAFDNNGKVALSYLYKMIPWKRGDCFQRSKIEAFRASLLSGGLFSRADINLSAAPGPDGAVAIRIDLKERAPRSVSAGLNYYTDEGPGITFGWIHRNFFGAGESFNITLTLSTMIQKLSASLTKPFFLRQDQTLTVNAALNREDTDAYRKFGLQGGTAIKRSVTPHLTGGTGVNFDLNRTNDFSTGEKENFALVSFPQTVTYDSRDKALDATKGWLLDGLVSPYVDALGQSSPFIKTQFGARTYIGLNDDLVLALRVKAGSILGPDTASIPAAERFYAGGGGSVRGFGYQDIGPRDNGQPSGGRSLAEGSIEVRYKITDTIGAVTFVDAGTVSAAVAPDFQDLAIGAGVGLRYYTSFGPLRLDVGVPVMKPDTTSSQYGVYLSIGQAF